MAATSTRRCLSYRPAILSLAKGLVWTVGQLPIVRAAPFHASSLLFTNEEGKDPEDPSLWLYLGIAATLVLLGGAFAGLTIALMGQDEIYLQVIKTSGEGTERKHAEKVLNLLGKGKHWVLVTLLLGNVITNETLPIVLDRSLGGGWPAVLGSTVLIVIFGEVAPQSVCVRYGLPIGSWMAPCVLGLMYILAPIAWPTAKLLDWLLGEDHGTVYKKAGLKTLVSLHKSLGETGQQLNTDEVTIISAVLDLKDKSIGSIMTPMDDVFTLSLDDVLDEETMDILLTQGYSRIPIHHPDNDENFVGMLLVKMLITYDPEDAKPVREFALATLPETSPHTSCLDIVNFFQEGKSHMVLVSNNPGGDHGALGVVTLEDVIEELIGEEIIDESDVFIDVHKAIRRLAPAPRTRIPKPHVVTDGSAANGASSELIDVNENGTLSPEDMQRIRTADSLVAKPKPPAITMRRKSSATNSNAGDLKPPKRGNTEEMREHLKHLGPSNLASRPRTTRYNAVKIKPGNESSSQPTGGADRIVPVHRISETTTSFQTGVGEEHPVSGGKAASDGVQALQQTQSYGSIGASPVEKRPTSASKGVQADLPDHLDGDTVQNKEAITETRGRRDTGSSKRSRSHSTIRSLRNVRSRSPSFLTRGPARSGSITENIIEANGIRKVVLETTSSSSNEDDENTGAEKGSKRAENKKSNSGGERNSSHVSLRGGGSTDHIENQDASATKKKKQRRKKHGHGKGEHAPLLGGDH